MPRPTTTTLLLLLVFFTTAAAVKGIHVCGRPSLEKTFLAPGRYYISYFGPGSRRGQNLNLGKGFSRLRLVHGAPFMWTLEYPDEPSDEPSDGFTLRIEEEGHAAQGYCLVRLGNGLRLHKTHCSRFELYQIVRDGYEAEADLNDAEFAWQDVLRSHHHMSHVKDNPVLSWSKRPWKFQNEASDLPLSSNSSNAAAANDTNDNEVELRQILEREDDD